MKASTKVTILMMTGCALMMIGVFAKPLGIPSDLEGVPMLMGVPFIYLGYRASKKAKAAGQIPVLPDAQKRKRFVLLVAVTAVTCVCMPFVMPFTGVVLPFAEMVIICIVSFFICIGAFWLGIKMRT